MDENIVKEMVCEGVLFGHKHSKTNPKMRPHIGGIKNEIEILNPESVFNSLTKAEEFLKEKSIKGGVFLLLGTKPASKKAIKEFADEFGFPYVISRWLGGTLTNFDIIHKRVVYYEDLKEKEAKGELEKYTKREKQKFVEKIEKMSGNFEGLRLLKKVPDVLFFVDGEAHETAIREAKRMKIPIVGIIDTDDDPDEIDYPIFASDHSVKGVSWVINQLKEAIRSSRPSVE